MQLLHYKTYGEKSNPSLCIIHGLFGSLDNWMTLSKMWSVSHYVIALDVRNHGRSFHSDSMRFEDLCRDILNVLDNESIEKTILLGHSMGGKIAMEFAAIYPERLEKLAILDVAPYVYPPHHSEVFHMLDHIALEEFDSRQAIEVAMSKYLKSISTIQFMAKNIRRNESTMRFEWKFNYPVLERDYIYLIQWMPSRGYDGQTIFIGGERSDYITKETGIYIFDLYPNAELEYIPNAGHWIHADNPSALFDRFNLYLIKH